jgi:hypothetical protein
LHEVFEASFDIKECDSFEFIKQKLNYMHFNPCAGKWNLADMPEILYIVLRHFMAMVYKLFFQGTVLAIT